MGAEILHLARQEVQGGEHGIDRKNYSVAGSDNTHDANHEYHCQKIDMLAHDLQQRAVKFNPNVSNCDIDPLLCMASSRHASTLRLCPSPGQIVCQRPTVVTGMA